jgi:hypothetical protein
MDAPFVGERRDRQKWGPKGEGRRAERLLLFCAAIVFCTDLSRGGQFQPASGGLTL